MAELPFEMPNLLKFPMGQLCYDLVLEVIDELDPKDVPELMKADRRFRWILLQKPARILGKQIYLISVEKDYQGSLDDGREHYQNLVFIRKFAESRPLCFYFLSHKVLLLSQVERCSVLIISESTGMGNWLDMKRSALKKAFANLKQVDELQVNLCGSNFNDFLWNLKAEVTDRASLRFQNLGVHQQLRPSINGRLQNCKMISVDLDKIFIPDFYQYTVLPTVYSALSKTQPELFMTKGRLGNVKSTIEWILNSGIPSDNKKAACVVHGEMLFEIKNLIKKFPEIREVNEPIKTFIGDTMMETLRKHGFRVESCDRSDNSLFVSDHARLDSDHSRSDSEDSLHSMDLSPMKRRIEHHLYLDSQFDCYLKRIDQKRDCIYVFGYGFFFAKYVSSIQF